MAWAKRLAVAGAKERKAKGKFIVSPRGPHKKSASIPLLVALRDEIKLAETYTEGKNIIKRKEILVDGKICTDHKLGLGLMDTLSIPSASLYYRVVPGKKGLRLLEIPEKEFKIKVCKITRKTAVRGGKIQYSFHDGRNIIFDGKYKTRDSFVISLPEQKMMEHLKFEKGNIAFVTTGKNTGLVADLEKIDEKMKRVWLKKDSELFEAPFDYVMVIGKDKPAITVE